MGLLAAGMTAPLTDDTHDGPRLVLNAELRRLAAAVHAVRRPLVATGWAHDVKGGPRS